MKRKLSDSFKHQKKRQRTWSEYGKQVAAGSSAATLGFIVGNVPTALEAGMAAYEYTAPNLEEEDGIEDLYNAAFGEGFPQNNMLGVSKGSGLINAVEKDKSVCQKKGFVKTLEVYGTVNDPNIVYISHSTYSAELYAQVVGQALIRKLLKKAGFDVTQWFETVNPLVWNSTVTTSATTGWLFQFTSVLIDGTVQNYNYVFENGIKLVEVGDKNFSGYTFGFVEFLRRCLTNVDKDYSNARWLRLFQETGQATSPYSLVAQINLQEEKIHLMSHSTVTMQNRTQAASSTTQSAQIFQVDQQPLVGKIYNFRNSLPRIVGDGISANFELERLDKNGMELIRGDQLTFEWSKPPTKSSFGNCSKVYNVGLGVGHIKTVHIASHYSGKLLDFLGKYSSKALNTVGAIGTQYYSYVPGKCQMVALEEEINTGSTNKITIGYQCSKTVGCYSTTVPTPCSLEQRVDAAYDNTT